jgi:hypothetical protein
MAKKKLLDNESITKLLEEAISAPVETTEEVVVTEVATPVSKPTPTPVTKPYPKAYNIYYDKNSRGYHQVVIEYDVETGYSKIVSNTYCSDNMAVSLNKLNKVLSLKLLRREEQ